MPSFAAQPNSLCTSRLVASRTKPTIMWLTTKCVEVDLPLRAEHRLVLAQREQLLDEDEDQGRAEQVEDEPVEADVGRVVGEVVDRHLVAAERQAGADQHERDQRQPARPAHDDVEERQRAGDHQRPEQQQAHRIDVVGLAQLRRRQVLREVEGEHAEEAEERQRRARSRPMTMPLPGFSAPCDARQAMQLLDRLHGCLRRPAPCRRAANYEAPPRATALRPRPCGSPAGRARRGRAPGSRPAPSPPPAPAWRR